MKKLGVLLLLLIKMSAVLSQSDTLKIVKKDVHSISSNEMNQSHTFKIDKTNPEIVYENEISLIQLQILNYIMNNYWDTENTQYLAMDFHNWINKFKIKDGIKSDSLSFEITSWFRKQTDDKHFIFQDVGVGNAGAVKIVSSKHTEQNDYNFEKVSHDEKNEGNFFKSSVENIYGIRKSGIAYNNVGYLEYTLFHPKVKESTNAIDKVLDSFRETKAIIIDLRSNGGGDGDMAAYILGYFIKQDSLPLWRFQSRYEGVDSEEIKHTYSKNDNDLNRKDIYVLTSKNTGSSAELFVQFCKSHQLATVVGERTAGATHPMATFKVSDRFTFGLPHGRIIDLKTNKDTQIKNGIEPDILVSSNQALSCVMEIINKK